MHWALFDRRFVTLLWHNIWTSSEHDLQVGKGIVASHVRKHSDIHFIMIQPRRHDKCWQLTVRVKGATAEVWHPWTFWWGIIADCCLWTKTDTTKRTELTEFHSFQPLSRLLTSWLYVLFQAQGPYNTLQTRMETFVLPSWIHVKGMCVKFCSCILLPVSELIVHIELESNKSPILAILLSFRVPV